MNALDAASCVTPFAASQSKNSVGRARIGAARVRVADIGGEEFEEAIGSTGAARGDERGGVVTR